MADTRFSAVIDFWASHLANPAPKQALKPSHTKAQAFAAITANTHQPTVTPEQVELFKGALLEIMVEHNKEWHYFAVGTDNSPDHHLQKALTAAGIRAGLFALPWKTMSWIKPLYSEVALGYKGCPMVAGLAEHAFCAVMDIEPTADIKARHVKTNWNDKVTRVNHLYPNQWYLIATDAKPIEEFAISHMALVLGWRHIELSELQAGMMEQQKAPVQTWPSEVWTEFYNWHRETNPQDYEL